MQILGPATLSDSQTEPAHVLGSPAGNVCSSRGSTAREHSGPGRALLQVPAAPVSPTLSLDELQKSPCLNFPTCKIAPLLSVTLSCGPVSCSRKITPKRAWHSVQTRQSEIRGSQAWWCQGITLKGLLKHHLLGLPLRPEFLTLTKGSMGICAVNEFSGPAGAG